MTVGTGMAVAKVVPAVLEGSGLDEAEVQAGMAVFVSLATLAGIRTVGKVRPRVRGSRAPRPGRGSAARDKSAKDYLAHWRMRVGKDVEASRAYPQKQIYVRKPTGNGYWILDYYDPAKGEIVSFKDTQLASIKVKSAIGYLNEIVRKYPPGRIIADVPSSKGLAGTKLKGRMFLDVPVQMQPIPKAVLEAATKRKITIRDSNGTTYN